MVRRVLWATAGASIVVLGALWFALGPFTTEVTVDVTSQGRPLGAPTTVDPDMVALGVPPGPGTYRMTVRCSRQGGVFVGTDGEQLFWNSSMPIPVQHPTDLCAEQRPVRATFAAGFALVAMLVGAMVVRRSSERGDGAEAVLPPPRSTVDS